MNRKSLILIVVAVAIVLGAVLLFVNRVQVQATALKVADESRKIAEKQTIDNWELFFEKQMVELGAEVAGQEKRLLDLRVDCARDKAQVKREQKLLTEYEATADDLAKKLKAAGSGDVAAYGRKMTREQADAQLREFAGAVIDQRTKVEGLTAAIKTREQTLEEYENNLRTAKSYLVKLRERGREMVAQKSLAELKNLSAEITNAIGGLGPDNPISAPMRRMHDLLGNMQNYIDTVNAKAEVTVTTAAGETRVITIDRARQWLDYSERDKQIDAEVQKRLTKP